MRWLAIICVLWAGMASAEGPTESIRPVGRVSTSTPPEAPIVRRIAPQERPREFVPYIIEAGSPDEPRPVVHYRIWVMDRNTLHEAGRDDLTQLYMFSPYAPAQSLHPLVRPAAITQQAREREAARRRGQVCGNPAIQGTALGAVPGRGACGIDSGVRVRSVSGVSLGPQATMDCRTATALNNWVNRSAAPAVGEIGGGIASLRVVSHYSCRFRNSASSGKLSEHSFGRAIDIAGIGLKNGGEITVLTDWGNGSKGRALRRMWSGACGIFGTVLGPESNRFHRDHFHFDTARYRSGSYCR